MDCWNILKHQGRGQIWDFAEKVRKKLIIRNLVIINTSEYSQDLENTCGTLTLMNLGHVIGSWKEDLYAKEIKWYK